MRRAPEPIDHVPTRGAPQRRSKLESKGRARHPHPLGQALIVLLIVLAKTWGATEWVAWHLAFQPELRLPWWRLDGFPVYPPPALFW